MATAHMTEEDNRELEPGDQIADFRGEVWNFVRVTRPPQEGRSAKVEVQDPTLSIREGGLREFYSTVFPGLEVRN